MTLDGSKPNDQIFVIDDITFAIDASLLAQAQPIKIDIDNGYLKVDCAIVFKKTAKQCGGCSCGQDENEKK